MKKIIFLIAALLTIQATFAQQGKKVRIVSSELLKGFKEEGFMRIIKPVFEQEGSTLAADSANFSQEKNTFDAFGHVVITQSNGTIVYADLLNFDGNKKEALLTNNIRLVDKDATLYTNNLTYNTGTRIGTYVNGGKIVDSKNVLTSVTGYYFTNTRDAYFKNNVVITSPDGVIKSDTLRYNSGSKIAYFYGPTHLYGKNDTLYTENGDYNTLTQHARFGKKNHYTQSSKSLKGDSLFFDRKTGYGRAIKNVTFTDTTEKVTFKGEIGIYHKKDESILATRNAYIILQTESDSSKVDSVWLAADTLFSKVVRGHEVQPILKVNLKKDNELEDTSVSKPDSHLSPNSKPSPSGHAKFTESTAQEDKRLIKEVISPEQNNKASGLTNTLTQKISNLSPDSLARDTAKVRIVFAYHKAKIFKSDLQAKADSIFFSYKDSTIRCYSQPMIWTQGSQFSADTIYLQMKNKKLDNMLLQRNGFIVGTEASDSSKFNQVKGKLITGYFKNNKLNNLFVDGNAESVYYVKEEKEGKTGKYTGMNKMLSSRMKVLFEHHMLKDISFIRKPEGTYYPIKQIPTDQTILPGFIWKPKDRPKSKDEIIPSLTNEVPILPKQKNTKTQSKSTSKITEQKPKP